MKLNYALTPLVLCALLTADSRAQVISTSPLSTSTDDVNLARPLRVFLVAGQSNAEGHDAHAGEIDSFPPFVGAGAPQTGVLFWYETGFTANVYSSGGWIPLQPELQRQIFGPELTFASKVKDESAGRVAIIKSTCGGTNLAVDWDPGNPAGQRMYERTLALMQTALGELTNNGISWRLEGVLWQQGENDMLNSTYVTEYGWRLTALIDRFRTDLAAPHLEWFVGEASFKGIWGIDFRANMQILRAQQLMAVDADPQAHFVPTSHLAFAINTGQMQPHYHFGAEGQLQLGEAHAAAYLGTIGIDQAHESEPFCCGTPADAGETVRVFVLAGQRSMEGERAYVSDIQDHAAFDGVQDLQHDVFYRYRLGGGSHTSTDWAPLGPTDYLQNFGPELSFGDALADQSAEPIAIVKITDSAAFLEDWLPAPTNASRPQYAAAVDFIDQAMADLQSEGFNPVLEAVVWLPGEHDAWWTPFRNQYAANLTTLVASLRTDLQAPALKWFVAELSDHMIWGQTKLDELDAQIQSVAAVDPLLWFVDTDAVPVPDQSPVFETEGVLHLGELLARFYLAH